MNKHVKTSRSLTVFCILMLTIGVLATLPLVKATPGLVIMVDPASKVYTTNDISVGATFVVDVTATSDVAWKVMMCQVYITYNKNYLAPTMKGSDIVAYPSGKLGISPPENWNPDYIFYGKSGTIGNPSLQFPSSDPQLNAIMLGETLLGDTDLSAGKKYLLARFNFTIIAVPGKGETFETALGINNDQNFIYDSNGPVIQGPDPNIHDGLYRLSWAKPAPAHLDVVLADASPWPLVFREYEDAVGKVFDVNIRLHVDPAWGLTNATFTLNYNETLIKVIGGAANVTIDSFWTEPPNITFDVDKITILVRAPSAPGPDALVATIKFTVMYQGVAPYEDSTDLTFSDVALWDHQYQIDLGTHGKGTVTIKGKTQLPDPDVNNDHIVDMKDLYEVATHFGFAYELNDLNGDGIINIVDLYLVASHFGEAVP